MLRRTTPPRLQSVDRLDRARCFSLNDVHSRRDHERAQGRRPANIKTMAATGRNGVSNADERTRRARSARPSADKCSTFRINGRSADELRLAQVRMPTGAGAKMILQVHLPRDGPAHGRVGHPILRCVRQTPRVRWIAHRACSLGGRHISKRLRDSKQKSRFGQRGLQSLSWHGRRSFRTVTRKGMPNDARAQIAQNSWYGEWWTQGPAPSIRYAYSQAGASIAGAAEGHNA